MSESSFWCSQTLDLIGIQASKLEAADQGRI